MCDRCNNGPLAALDQCLADFMPLWLRRTTLGIPNKLGRLPATVFQDARLELVEGRPALTGPAPQSWQVEQVDPRDPRWSVGHATLTGGRPLKGRHAAQISRALLKVGFEAAWTDLDEQLMAENFDELRAPILGQRHQSGYVFLLTHLDESDAGHSIHYDAIAETETARAHLYVAAKMLGVYIVTDSFRSAPPPGLAEEFGELGHTASF